MAPSGSHRRAALVIEFVCDPKPARVVECLTRLLEAAQTNETDPDVTVRAGKATEVTGRGDDTHRTPSS